MDSWQFLDAVVCFVSTVTRQLATDAVVYASSHSVTTAGIGMPWDSRSSEVSTLISGRLRRMVSEVFGKHFGVFVLMEYHEFQFCLLSRLVLHRRVTAHPFTVHASAGLKFLVLSHLSFAPRFIHMSSMSA